MQTLKGRPMFLPVSQLQKRLKQKIEKQKKQNKTKQKITNKLTENNTEKKIIFWPL